MRRRWRPSRLVAQVGQISPSEFDPSRLLLSTLPAAATRRGPSAWTLPLALSLRSDAHWQAATGSCNGPGPALVAGPSYTQEVAA